MRNRPTRPEAQVLAAVLMLLAFVAASPALLPFARIHEFADARMLRHLPNALNVLSGAGFGFVGAAGLIAISRLRHSPWKTVTNMQRAMAVLFFCGLVLLAIGSALYHLAPADAVLAVQRYCLVPVVAGLLGLAAAGRVSERAAAACGIAALASGLAAAWWCLHAGDVLPWAVFQYGSLVLVAYMACLPPLLRALPIGWTAMFLIYGVAKFLEIHDAHVFDFTGQRVSGHTLQHLAAALAAWPVVSAVARSTQAREDAQEPFDPEDLPIRWTTYT